MSAVTQQTPASAPPLGSVRDRLSAVLGNSRKLVVALAACSIVSGFLEACLLALVAQIASTAVKGGSHVREHLGPVQVHASIKTLFVLAFAIALARIVLQFPMAYLPARIAARVQGSLRRRLFAAYSRASWARQAEDREGHLQEIMTSQVLQATGGALQATQIVIAGFQFLVLMISAIVLNVIAALVVLVAAVILFGALRPLNRLGARRARELSRAQLSYAAGVSEANRLAQETQVFGVAAAQRKRLDVLIRTAQDLFYRAQFVLRITPNLYQSIIYLILLGGLAALYASGRSHFVGLGASVLVILRAGTYGQVVQAAYQALRQSLPFIERLQDNERRYAQSIPRDRGEPLPEIETLAFDHVTFGYRPGQPVLRELTFEVDAGEAIGVIGPSGAGKSTLIQLLLRLRSPEEGAFLVNGCDALGFARRDWQRRVAYVPQEPRLIHASVTDNIRYFRDIDDAEVERAARLARIHDDVTGWEKGYDTIVGPRADAVSGGQQQRICLARALAGRPEVLVLDEPTSALDPHSEMLIQESLTGLREELTLFVIAHRMSTLDVCDRVMVIVDGRLVAFDTTALLQQSNSYYRSASTLAAGGVLP